VIWIDTAGRQFAVHRTGSGCDIKNVLTRLHIGQVQR